MRIPRSLATFLARHRVAHLATADASGRPHVIPICYAIGGTILYSVVDRKPKRVAPGRLRRRYRQYRTMDLDGRPVIAVSIRRAVVWGRLDRPGGAAR